MFGLSIEGPGSFTWFPERENEKDRVQSHVGK